MDVERSMVAHPTSVDRHVVNEHFGAKHTFTPGLYCREYRMAKDSLVISRIHMFEHPFIISKGDVSVYDGREVVRLKAPYQGITKPGTKRILYCHEDTIWTTFHVTDKTTIEELDPSGTVTCDTFEEYDKLILKEIAL